MRSLKVYPSLREIPVSTIQLDTCSPSASSLAFFRLEDVDIVHKIIQVAKLQYRVICRLCLTKKGFHSLNKTPVNINLNIYSWIHLWYLKRKPEVINHLVINMIIFFKCICPYYLFWTTRKYGEGKKKENKRKWFSFERIIEREVGE